MCDMLNDFQQRRKNLIISTNVLEEGIDITACYMVICFNKPPNLKSFVQRRGRAR
jgi:ERCC4-related helicase